jgi:hypothetical protein
MEEPITIYTYPNNDSINRYIFMDTFLIKISSNDKKDDDTFIFEKHFSDFIKMFKDTIYSKLIIGNNKINYYTKNINSIKICKNKNCNKHYYSYINTLYLPSDDTNSEEKDDEDNKILKSALINSNKISNNPFNVDDYERKICNNNCKCSNGNIKTIVDDINESYFTRIVLEKNKTLKFYNLDKLLYEIDTEIETTVENNKYIFKSLEKKLKYKLSYYYCCNNDIYLIVTNKKS